MKFVCDRCQTKYSIADEKVRGKILKVRCKACTNIITVREEAAGAGAAPIRRPSAPVAPVGARPPTPAVPRTPLGPPATAPIERRAAPRPEPPADDGVAWYMALDGNRTGPFSRKQLIDRVAPLPKDADLHVWNEKLGSWKPPTEVPALAHDLAARRRPPTPAPMPPPPPPFPGAPRRPTAPAVPVAAAAAPSPARQTGAHPVVGSAIGPGVGLKLPPPVAPPGGRRPTGPVVRPIGLAELAPATTSGSSTSSGSSDAGLDIDPSTMLETPAPQLHMLHGRGTNGVAHAAESASVSNGTSTAAEKSDVLNTLNLTS
ncbi:MAG TPA: zinc-ribbon domain-containing protein, partial [Polyangia bacterium]|nr:zinc-ribbon domain-containing protein [Polyangia bacterium]